MCECTEHDDVLGASRETVVLAVRLLDQELGETPQRIARALEGEDFKRAIREVLEAEARRLAELQVRRQEITNEEGEHLLRALAESGSRAVLQSVQSQVEASSKYQQVKLSLQRLEKAFRCSPMGVFIDENSTWLYIVATGLALGGAAALYVTRSGDPVANFSTDLAARTLRSIRLGSLTVGTSGLRFVPSERVVEVQPFVSFRAWRQVETTFRLRALFQQDQLHTARGTAQLVVPLGRGVRLQATAGGGMARAPGSGGPGPLQPVFDLRLAITVAGPPETPGLRVQSQAFLTQDTTQRQAGGAGRLEYHLGHGMTAHVQGSAAHTIPLQPGRRGGPEFSVQGGFTARFE